MLTLTLFPPDVMQAEAAVNILTVNVTGTSTLESHITSALTGLTVSDYTTLKVTGGSGVTIQISSTYMANQLPNATTLDLSTFEGAFGSSAFRNYTNITAVKLPQNATNSNICSTAVWHLLPWEIMPAWQT